MTRLTDEQLENIERWGSCGDLRDKEGDELCDLVEEIREHRAREAKHALAPLDDWHGRYEAALDTLEAALTQARANALTAEDRIALRYMREQIERNPVAACQDSVSKHHTAMVNAACAAIAKLLGGES